MWLYAGNRLQLLGDKSAFNLTIFLEEHLWDDALIMNTSMYALEHFCSYSDVYAVVDETLRMLSPASFTTRKAIEDLVVMGKHIPARLITTAAAVRNHFECRRLGYPSPTRWVTYM